MRGRSAAVLLATAAAASAPGIASAEMPPASFGECASAVADPNTHVFRDDIRFDIHPANRRFDLRVDSSQNGFLTEQTGSRGCTGTETVTTSSEIHVGSFVKRLVDVGSTTIAFNNYTFGQYTWPEAISHSNASYKKACELAARIGTKNGVGLVVRARKQYREGDQISGTTDITSDRITLPCKRSGRKPVPVGGEFTIEG